MRWLVIAVMLIAFPPRAWGQWVAFEACGMRFPKENSRVDGRVWTEAAPNIGPYLIWPGPGMVILGLTEKVSSELSCSEILISGRRIRVVGSVKEVERKLLWPQYVRP